MKKYLMTGMAAVALCGAFTSCSRESDFGAQTPQQSIQETYETAFRTRFGDPAPEQNWGFGPSLAASRAMTRSGNTSGDYVPFPATHEYTDANGNVIAGANMNHNEWGDPNTKFGGWIVPDTLTAGQKLRVQKYFQANPNLSYEDPHYANFFIQQVYTGGTDAPETGNKESTKAANGQVHAGSTLNQLTVGQACSHINDFNAGTCTSSNVLNHEGKTQSDQITLMVNVDDTSCFGYHETGGSNVKGVINHNDKMALVSADSIDAWAAANGNPGEPVVDKWNRSFIGFDYELLPEEDIIPENPTYAKFTDVPSYNNFTHVVLNGQVMKIGEPVATSFTPNLTSKLGSSSMWNGTITNNNGVYEYKAGDQWWGGFDFNIGGEDWSNCEKLVVEFAEAIPGDCKVCIKNNWQDSENATAHYGDTRIEIPLTGKNINKADQIYFQTGGGTYKINSITVVGEAAQDNTLYFNEEYLLGNDNMVMYYSGDNTNMYGGTIITPSASDWTTPEGYLNLDYFKDLADHDYHPTSGGALQKWVKWEKACDGYYSDWIVTLTEAKRQDENQPDTRTETESLRVIAEDLSVGENTDFDFNDVVFDVVWTKNYTDDQLTSQNVKVVLQAAGGTLPLYVAGHEVHEEYGEDTNVMINTKAAEQGYRGNDNAGTREIPLTTDDWSGSDIYEIANSIDIYVIKNETECHLSAPVGGIASKIGVKTNYKWCKERQDIEDKYSLEDGTSPFREWVNGIYPANDWYGYAKNEIVKYRAAKAALNGE